MVTVLYYGASCEFIGGVNGGDISGVNGGRVISLLLGILTGFETWFWLIDGMLAVFEGNLTI